MSADDRYDVSGLPEAQFEPGSDGMVLKNLLGITSKQTMDEAEARALEQAMDILIRNYSETHRFTAADLNGFSFPFGFNDRSLRFDFRLALDELGPFRFLSLGHFLFDGSI